MSEVKNVMKAVWIIYLIDFFGENQFEAWCGYSNWDLGSYEFVTGLADSCIKCQKMDTVGHPYDTSS